MRRFKNIAAVLTLAAVMLFGATITFADQETNNKTREMANETYAREMANETSAREMANETYLYSILKATLDFIKG